MSIPYFLVSDFAYEMFVDIIFILVSEFACDIHDANKIDDQNHISSRHNVLKLGTASTVCLAEPQYGPVPELSIIPVASSHMSCRATVWTSTSTRAINYASRQ